MKKYNKSMLTVDLLDRFEAEGFTADLFTDSDIKWIEHAAYVAMMNNHNGSTEDAYADFFRVMKIHGINPTTNTNTTEEEEDNTMTTTETTTAAIINAFNDALDRIINRPYANRSAWSRGVTIYAAELLDGLKEAVDGGWFDADDLRAPRLVARELLNGADDWKQYSWGGSSLIYDGQIAERLCNKSELKQTRNGEREPNKREQWLDVQSRALYQAAKIVTDAITAAAAYAF